MVKPRRLRSFFAAFVAVAGIGTVPAIAGVELGSLQIRSSIGQPLLLEIELRGAEAGDLDTRCYRIRQLSAAEDESLLRGARLGLVTLSRRSHLEITTRQAVADPLLHLVVDAYCGGEARGWAYAVPLSPGEAVSASSGEPALPATVDVVVPDLRGRAQGGPAERTKATKAVKATAVPAGRQLEATASVSPMTPARPVATSAALPGLRLATELRPVPVPTEPQRNLLRLEYRLIQALGVQVASQQEIIEKLRVLEETQATLRGLGPAGTMLPQAAPTALKRLPPASGPEPPADGLRQLVFGPAGLLSLAAVLLIGALAVWKRRRPQRNPFAEAESADLPEAGAAERIFQRHAPLTLTGFDVAVTDVATGGELRPAPLPQAKVPERRQPEGVEVTHEFAPTREPFPAQHEEFREDQTVVELAEMMLGFGRVTGATELLNQYINANPGEALKPWVVLLDVYRKAGMADEFERAAGQLNKHFNVQVEAWDAHADLSLVARSIEAYPHIVEKLTATWRTPECLAYLHHLLRDNRAGERHGFARQVAEELMLLIDILEPEIPRA